MRTLSSIVMLLFCLQASAGVIYSQPPDATATGVIESAWYPPDGLDGDNYTYDAFTLGSSQGITEIQWRGGYTNLLYGAGESPVFDFTISIYPSIGAGTQPDITALPLVQYSTGDNAGETPVGTVGGIPLYDYHFILPSPFQATGGTKYWLQIEASQGLTPVYYWPPDWGFTVGTGGDGTHFHAITGGTAGGGTLYQTRTPHLAFTLFGADAPTVAIVASASPANGGTIQGEGAYPIGSLATLVATPNAGFGFVEWTENGVQVSNSAQYSFTATANRTLLANFTPAYTITTASFPTYGGTTAGDGIYNSGSSVTVVATPRLGYYFTDWTEFGTSVSPSASYTFAAGTDRPLVANFTPGPLTVTFDLQNGTPPPVAQGTATPFDQTLSGVTAHFSSPEDGGPYHPAFSLQSDATLYDRQLHLTGNYLFPGTVYRNDLDIRFSRPVTGIGLDFATVEYQFEADPPSPLKITAYNDSTANPPVGSAQTAGQYIGTSYPEGMLSFSSAVPFNLVRITVGPNNWGTVNFLADNITVVALRHGDMNCDGVLSFADINPFVLALSSQAGYETQYPLCSWLNADCNGDGVVSFADINAFVACLSSGGCP